MLQKLLTSLEPLFDNVSFAFWASFTTAMMRPQESQMRTIKIAVSTTMLGTLVGMSIQGIDLFAPFRYAIVTLVGLFGKEIFEWLAVKMKNPLDFFRNLNGHKTTETPPVEVPADTTDGK